jgi:putative intracellular protease/amidase
MRKAIIVVTNHESLGGTGQRTGWDLADVAHSYYKLTEAGLEVEFVSPNGGKAPMDKRSRNLGDDAIRRFLGDAAAQALLQATLRPEEISPAECAVIFFAGGHGAMWDFPEDGELQRLAAAIYEAGGVVAAVSHGSAALINVRLSDGRYLVEGRGVAPFTTEEEIVLGLSRTVPFRLEEELEGRGARVIKVQHFEPHYVVNERFVTGQNPASASKVAEAVVRMLRPRLGKLAMG